MRLSSLADYAVVMMTAAARHRGEARLTATVLAEETGVPLADRAEADGPAVGRRAAPVSRAAAEAASRLARAGRRRSASPTSSRRSKARSR